MALLGPLALGYYCCILRYNQWCTLFGSRKSQWTPLTATSPLSGKERAMHKTYVVLEDWQYEALRTLAAQEQRSISALVREMLTQHLTENQATARQRLAAMEGIGADAHATGQKHDAFLYSTR